MQPRAVALDKLIDTIKQCHFISTAFDKACQYIAAVFGLPPIYRKYEFAIWDNGLSIYTGANSVVIGYVDDKNNFVELYRFIGVRG